MAITVRYVSSAGTDTYANSTNSATPCSLTTAFANAAAGDHFKIIADGTYTRSASDTLTMDGTTTSPIVWEGVAPTTFATGAVGRASGGALTTTNMPLIAYDAGFQLNAGGADSHIWIGLRVTANHNSYAMRIGVDSAAVNCLVSNTNTGTSTIGLDLGGARGSAIDCDVSVVGGAGATCVGLGAYASGTMNVVVGNRVTCTNSIGIRLSATAGGVVANNTVYNCGTDGIYVGEATSNGVIFGNTIFECGGDAIDIVTSTSVAKRIFGNCITDNTGNAVNFNTSTVGMLYCFNRTRDNGGTVAGGSADWLTVNTHKVVTTDTGDEETDYTDAGTNDFSLIPASPAINNGPGYLIDSGANGTPVVTGGGGGIIQGSSGRLGVMEC
jgi:parallel beta-helix repeat protein